MEEAERPSVSSDFGKLLRYYRISAGLSQEALAERACLSPFAISALERGHRRKPQAKTLVLLANALALDVAQRMEFEAAARSAPARLEAVTVGPWANAPLPSAVPNNLPRQVTPLVGRAQELAEIADLVRAHPLTTLAGAGGVGKTRLALHVGETLLEAPFEGIWFVELAASHDPASVVQAMASTFGLRKDSNQTLLDAALQYLHSRRFLLIVDNCEHVIEEAARVVDAILHHAEYVRILATSREPLGIPAEHVFRVPSLAVPQTDAPSAEEASLYGATALFAERAEAAAAGFRLTDDIAPAVAKICARLDGLPLAIELAAARTSVLSVPEIAEKLHHRFSILTGARRSSIPRQQTLHALVEWSYDLLTDSERTLFRSLGVFPGDFSLDAIGAMRRPDAGDDAFGDLTPLVEKSLVHAEMRDGKTRYRLLESVRAYARDRLVASCELHAASASHARAYLEVAQRLESIWETTPDVTWKAEAEPELENWRAALRWAFAADGDVQVALQLTAALRPVWFTLAPAEGLSWVLAALDACNEKQPKSTRGWLEVAAAILFMVMQQYNEADASAQRALAAFSDLDDKRGNALARLFSGAARGMLGEAPEARTDLHAAMEECRALGARREVGAALLYLAALELGSGDADAARHLFAEALSLFKILGSSRPAAHVALNLAELEFKSGNAAEALRLANEAFAADAALNDRDAVAYDLCNIAAYEIALGNWEASLTHAREALLLARERSMASAMVWALQHLAAISALRPADAPTTMERLRRAVRLVGFVDACVGEYGLQRDFTERLEREQILAAARDAVGAETDALIGAGRAWTEGRAIEESLLI